MAPSLAVRLLLGLALKCGVATDTPRHAYLDLGANYGDTIDLYRSLAHFPFNSSKAWEVYSFEASPKVLPFLEGLFDYKNGLVASRPTLCVPPCGSTKDCARFAPLVGCPNIIKCGWVSDPKSRCGYLVKKMQKCMADTFAGANRAQELSRPTNGLVHMRLSGKRGPAPATQVLYNLVPAAVGGTAGTLTFDAQGGMSSGSNKINRRYIAGMGELVGSGGAPAADVEVPIVDLPKWLSRSFVPDDYVIVKMDVEGAEFNMIDALNFALIDVMAIECHGSVGNCNELLAKVQKRAAAAGTLIKTEGTASTSKTYQPTVQWDPILRRFCEDLASQTCAPFHFNIKPSCKDDAQLLTGDVYTGSATGRPHKGRRK